MKEPILREEDLRAWDSWRRQALLHARSRSHLRMLNNAKRAVEKAVNLASRWAVMMSGGKDSTALTHLVCAEMGYKFPIGSEKDDLDFPGEEEYVTEIAAMCGAPLHILRPPFSAEGYLRSIAGNLLPDGNLHSRAAKLSKECFYNVVEAFSADYEGIFLGLRAKESRGRRMNRICRGLVYQKKAGQWVAEPLGDWEGIDVYAYLLSRDIPMLPVYKCIALMHKDDPAQIRKSWYVPGDHAAQGGIAWLRRYYPSLFDKLNSIIPGADRLA